MKQKYLPILLLIIFPFFLIRSLPLLWVRYLVGASIAVYLLAQAFLKYDLRKLGFFKPTRLDYLYFLPALPFLFIALALVIRLKLSNLCPPDPFVIPEETPAWLYLLAYALISAPVQEIIYRSLLINHLEEMFQDEKAVFILGVVLFSLVHIAWRAYFVLGSFFLGIYILWWFMKTRNIVLIMVAHILVGLAVMYFCFI